MGDEEEEKANVEEEEDDGPTEGIDEAELAEQKNKIKALGLEKESSAGFMRLMEHRKPPDTKCEDKSRRPFTF